MPWSVKGVDAEARETAKEAARRAGMTLGEWLNAMISENAADAEREQRETTLTDIAEQLSRLDRGASASAVARTAAPAGNDLQSVLRRAMAEARSQAQAVEDRTAGALESMVRWMERSEARRREDIGTIAAAQERTSTALRDALGLVTSRIDTVERRVSEDSGSQSLRKAIERLETRIDALDARETEGTVSPRFEKSLRDLEARLVDLAGRMDRPDSKADAHAARIDRIEASLGAILGRLDGAARKTEAAAGAPPPGSMEDAISQIRARQSMLDAQDFVAPVRAVGDAVTDALKADIAELAKRLDELRSRDSRPDLQNLRTDLADLTRTVRLLDPQERLGGIEQAVTSFGGLLEDLRRSQPDMDTLREPLDRLGSDLARIVHSLDPLRDIVAMRADLVSLAARLDDAQKTPLDGQTPELAREIAALRTTVEKAASAAQPVEILEKRLADIGAALQELVSSRTDLGIEDLRSTAQDMRGLIGSLPDFAGVERRLEDIARRMQEAPATGAAAAFPLDEMVERLGDRLEEARRPGAGSGAFDALERQLAAMTDALSRTDESYTAVRSLERSVASLFEKLEETARTGSTAAEEAAHRAARSVAATVAESVAQMPAPIVPAGDPRTREALDAVQSTLERIMDRLGSLEADMAAGRSRSDADLLANVEKAAQAAAPTVAEKIAAAAAAAKAAKAVEPPRAARAPETAPAAPPAPAIPAVVASVRTEAAAHRPPVQVSVRRAEVKTTPTVTATVMGDELVAVPVYDAPEQDTPVEQAAVGGVPDIHASDTITFDLPLEPGTGRPTQAEPARAEEIPASDPEVPAPEKATSSFIAAAREAAMAANSSRRGRRDQKAATRTPVTAPKGEDAVAARSGSVVERTRRPILIGLAVVVLALGTAQVLRNALAPSGDQAPADVNRPGPAEAPAAAPDRSSDAGKVPAVQEPTTTGTLPTEAPKPTGSVPPLPPGSLNPGPSSSQGSFVTPPRLSSEAVASLGNTPQPPAATIDPSPMPAPPLGDLGRALLPAALQKAAIGGNPAAAYEVASRLQEGRGIPRDPKLAARWFERAATLGLAPAQYRLGSMFEKGVGVATDIAAARNWYEKAAAKGNAKAMHNLGVLAADGTGGKPDYAAAAAWFRKAADLGVRDSQYNLAILTARGLGVQQNLVESYMWFSLAAAQGDEDAGRKREDVAARLDPGALATAKAAVDGFRVQRQDESANEVATPPGGWDDKGKSAKG